MKHRLQEKERFVVKMSLLWKPEEADDLKKLAVEENISVGKLMRYLVKLGLENYQRTGKLK